MDLLDTRLEEAIKQHAETKTYSQDLLAWELFWLALLDDYVHICDSLMIDELPD